MTETSRSANERAQSVPLLIAASLVISVSALAQDAAKPVRGENQIVVEGSTTVLPIAEAFRDYFKAVNKDVEISVSGSGSGVGAKALLNRTCDVGDMSRFMTDAEFKGAVERGVYPIAHVIAIDALAVIVHPSNPVANLTLDQLRSIYTGKVTNWKEVGGPDLKIVKINRDNNSGTYETFEHMVMHAEKVAPDAEVVGSNGQARQRVKSTPAAVAYVGLGFAQGGVKAIAVEKVLPDRGTVSTGRYALARPLYMFTNGYPKIGSPLHAFVTFYLTQKGQEIIEAKGFVPLTEYPATGDKDGIEDERSNTG